MVYYFNLGLDGLYIMQALRSYLWGSWNPFYDFKLSLTLSAVYQNAN